MLKAFLPRQTIDELRRRFGFRSDYIDETRPISIVPAEYKVAAPVLNRKGRRAARKQRG